jgi:membrane-associated phospholipid phosphatase
VSRPACPQSPINNQLIHIRFIAGIGAGINYVEPFKRPFSLLDLSISYPVVEEQIPIGLLAVIALVIPAVIIFLIVAVLVPGPRTTRGLSRKTMITRKLWEWEKGWAGLALALVVSFFITQGMKNLFGKPRPSCIARCQPDLNNVQQYVVGGYGQNLDPRWTLVSADICKNPNAHLVNDAFKSFPSGHASFSWAGLLYLFFFICSKFAIQIPYLPTQSPTQEQGPNRQSMAQELLPLHHNGEPINGQGPKTRDSDATATGEFARPVPPRNQAASPPNHLIVIAFIPVAVAVYICSTRFVEFYHFGFDLISGSIIGIGSAWFAFRWYHLPIGRGSGWAWGPRSKERAFGIGVGIGNYADAEGWSSSHSSGARQQRLNGANYANGADTVRGNESFQSYRGNEGGPAYDEERV